MKKKVIKVGIFPMVIESNDDGFLVRCPIIQGAFAEGDTVEGAIFNCIDVIEMILEYRKKRGEDILKSNIVETLDKNTHITFTLPVGIKL